MKTKEALLEQIDAYAEARHVQGHSTYNVKTSAARTAVASAVSELCALSVTNIMLAIVPGANGMGHEVFAKSVKEVEDKLTELAQELEDWRLGIRRYTPEAPMDGATYPELPMASAMYAVDGVTACWASDQMRNFADDTHQLRMRQIAANEPLAWAVMRDGKIWRVAIDKPSETSAPHDASIVPLTFVGAPLKNLKWSLGDVEGNWRDIDHEDHGGVMRIVWAMEEDAGKPNPELQAQAHAVVDALNAASSSAVRSEDLIDLVGVKPDGTEVNLGKARMPARMKAREIARGQFGHFEDGDGSDAELCFGAMEELLGWMEKQGGQQ